MVGKDYGDQARGTGAYSGQAPTGDGPTARELGQRLSNTQAQARANTARKEKERQDAIKEDIAKRELEKSKYDVGYKSVFEKIGDYNNKYRQKQIQKAIRRNKYSNLKELDALKQRSRFGIFGTVIDAINVPEEVDFFDTESPREIAAQLSKSNTGITATQSKAIGDLQQDIAMENTKNISQADFDKYNNRNRIVTREGNDNILPQYAMMGGGADMGLVDAVEPYTNDFTYRFGTGQNVGENVLRGYAADGGIMGTRARKAMGGIMNRVNQRQQFFLGGIGRAVGKVVGGVAKAAGKVLSSDIGKMAIAGAGIYYAGGGKKFFGGSGFEFGNLFNSGNRLLFSGAGTKADPRKFNPLKMAGLLTLGGAAMGPAKQDTLEGFDNRGGRLIDPLTGQEGTPASMRANIENAKIEAGGDPDKLAALNQAYNNMLFTNLPYANYGNYAQGGRIRAEEGGLMNLGGMEKDYRAEGGFVPIGKQEKADDVPARLSVNEFVFTADAVRNAGEGDIDKGAEVMENMMKNLENGGTVSEESQGNTGAQNMFSVSERIGEVI